MWVQRLATDKQTDKYRIKNMIFKQKNQNKVTLTKLDGYTVE